MGWWSSLLIHLSCLEDDVFIFRSSASSTSENTTQSMLYQFIKNRTTRLCNNYERIPSKDQRNKHEQNTEHEREHHNSQSYLLLVFTACVKILIKQFSMKSYFGWNNMNFKCYSQASDKNKFKMRQKRVPVGSVSTLGTTAVHSSKSRPYLYTVVAIWL